jgi:hypothetical protein
VNNGVEGIIIQPGNVGELAAAILNCIGIRKRSSG